MRSVYLIYESYGDEDWGDYVERIVDARFDMDDSKYVLDKLQSKLDSEREKLEAIQLLKMDGEILNTEFYDEYLKMYDIVYDKNDYFQKAIVVVEKNDFGGV